MLEERVYLWDVFSKVEKITTIETERKGKWRNRGAITDE